MIGRIARVLRRAVNRWLDDAEPAGPDVEAEAEAFERERSAAARHGLAPDTTLTSEEAREAGRIEIHLMCNADLRRRFDRLTRGMT